MNTDHHIQLTSAELSQLWGSYINDTLAVCMLQHFLHTVEDHEIRPVLQYAYDLSIKHLQTLSSLYMEESIPIPIGFSEKDVNNEAPRLFTDPYMLAYVKQMGELGLGAYGVSLALSTRSDIKDYFSSCIVEYIELEKMATTILLAKGLYIRPPYIPYPKKVDFVKKKNFLNGWFGERRPLVSLEITNLFSNIQRNALGVSTLIGFSQVAQSGEITRFFIRGKEIAAKHVEVFGSLLREDDLPVPMTSDSQVTDSMTPPFSDKLMLFATTSLIAIGIGYYGTSIATSPRRDIATHYSRLTAEIAKYAGDGANILIENGWMEEPPRAVDRGELTGLQ
jgi:hypothetical protein